MHITNSASWDSKAGILGLVVVLIIGYVIWQGISIMRTDRWISRLQQARKEVANEQAKSAHEAAIELIGGDSVDDNWEWNDTGSSDLENDPDVQLAMATMKEFKKGFY